MNYDPHIVRQQIEAEAQRLGFSAFGVCTVEQTPPHILARYHAWTAAGMHDEMDYMCRYDDVRTHPEQLLPGARSILCLALPYRPARLLPPEALQIARYAYGRDYHEVMKQRLRQLLQFARTLLPEAEGRVCVDTAPLFEKHWAQQAGLGWTGRHTQLILPRRGSMHFLGEILLTSELPPDRPCTRSCGQCRRCIDACPTGALQMDEAHPEAPARLDARRCLSCQTIERRGPLQPAAHAAIGRRIYGCDACLEACPHNRNTEPTAIAEFALSDQLLQMQEADWLQLTPETFRQLFRHSAIRRAGYESLMRNIRAALGRPTEEKPPHDTAPI